MSVMRDAKKDTPGCHGVRRGSFPQEMRLELASEQQGDLSKREGRLSCGVVWVVRTQL